MIASFGDDATADLFHGILSARARRFPVVVVKVALRKLDMVNAAAKLGDLKVPPGNRLESLSGNLAGRHSIRINDQWRIVLKWKDGNAHEVTLEDYH